MPDPISFAERRRLLNEKREREQSKTPQSALPEIPAEDVPDVLGERSEQDEEMDRVISNIHVMDAYRKWIYGSGKTIDEKTLGRREGIKVSCPNPDHPDRNPSAWINIDNDTWFCGGCQEGGDVYDLAAIKFHFPRPGYKDGKMFHDLREHMAESYGYAFKRELDGSKTMYKTSEAAGAPDLSSLSRNAQVDTADKLETAPAAPPQISSLSADSNQPPDTRDESDTSNTSDKSDEDTESSNVSQMWADEDDEDDKVIYPEMDWREVATEGTFLHEYCKATSNDDAPEEYHFWHGLLALAHAVGRNVYLDDTKPVYGNMLLCLLGGTGFGKSRSRHWLDSLLREVVPFEDNGLDCTGVKIITPPASGEHLIRSFQHVGTDPSLGKNAPVINSPVNGVVDFDEFSALLGRANRQGNTLKPILMQLADSAGEVKTGSLTHGDFIALRPFCSVTASTQPKSIRTLLSKTDAGSGFLNRWVFVGGGKKEREVVGGQRSVVRVDLTEAKDSLRNVRAWGSVERSVTLTDDAFKELERFYRREIFPIQDSDETDLLKRLDLLFKRLILLFSINERVVVADLHIIKLAEKMLNYVLGCYSIVSGEVGITVIGEISSEIIRHCIRHKVRTKRGASARDLQKYMAKKNYSPELFKRALETMLALDLIEVESAPAGASKVGRPTSRYVATVS